MTETLLRVDDLQRAPVPTLQAEVRYGENAEHFVVCMECGQAYDRRKLSRALYHAEPDHDPFFVES